MSIIRRVLKRDRQGGEGKAGHGKKVGRGMGQLRYEVDRYLQISQESWTGVQVAEQRHHRVSFIL